MQDNRSSKVRVNISISEETLKKIKSYAAKQGTNVSFEISKMIWDKVPDPHFHTDLKFNVERTLSITRDTEVRLEQYAYDHHTTVDQAITDWIWKQKVDNSQIRGQMSF